MAVKVIVLFIHFLRHTKLALLVELAVDSGGASLVPTITIEDVDKEAPKDAPQIPGQLPASKAPPIPDWYRVGWRAFTDIDKPLEDDDQRQLRFMNTWISEQYYGQWYHNASIIIFVCHLSIFYRSVLMLSSFYFPL